MKALIIAATVLIAATAAEAKQPGCAAAASS